MYYTRATREICLACRSQLTRKVQGRLFRATLWDQREFIYSHIFLTTMAIQRLSLGLAMAMLMPLAFQGTLLCYINSNGLLQYSSSAALGFSLSFEVIYTLVVLFEDLTLIILLTSFDLIISQLGRWRSVNICEPWTARLHVWDAVRLLAGTNHPYLLMSGI